MSAPPLPIRMRDAPANSRAAMLQVLQVVRRIELLASGHEALLEEYHGVEVNRAECLEWCGMLIEHAELAIKMLNEALAPSGVKAKRAGAE